MSEKGSCLKAVHRASKSGVVRVLPIQARTLDERRVAKVQSMQKPIRAWVSVQSVSDL